MAKSKFKIFIYQLVTRLKWQTFFTTFITAAFLLIDQYSCVFFNSLVDVGKSDFISFLGGISSVVALFCSVSFGFVIYFIQMARSERIATYTELKNKLREFDNYLSTVPDSSDKDICKAAWFELDKLEITDLPQTDYGEEYAAYVEALALGLENKEKREFYLNTSTHMGYIEQLLSRIGIISIQQIISKNFVDTLSKGIVLVSFMISVLFLANLFYLNCTKIYFFAVSLFVSIMTIFIFFEFLLDMYHYLEEELDFIDRSEQTYVLKD